VPPHPTAATRNDNRVAAFDPDLLVRHPEFDHPAANTARFKPAGRGTVGAPWLHVAIERNRIRTVPWYLHNHGGRGTIFQRGGQVAIDINFGIGLHDVAYHPAGPVYVPALRPIRVDLVQERQDRKVRAPLAKASVPIAKAVQKRRTTATQPNGRKKRNLCTGRNCALRPRRSDRGTAGAFQLSSSRSSSLSFIEHALFPAGHTASEHLAAWRALFADGTLPQGFPIL
jgi:hypothetical protein